MNPLQKKDDLPKKNEYLTHKKLSKEKNNGITV